MPQRLRDQGQGVSLGTPAGQHGREPASDTAGMGQLGLREAAMKVSSEKLSGSSAVVM